MLIIPSDDEGRGDYGAFGTAGIRTPAIDRLVREGMTFEKTFTRTVACVIPGAGGRVGSASGSAVGPSDVRVALRLPGRCADLRVECVWATKIRLHAISR